MEKWVPAYLVKFNTLVRKVKRLQVILHYNFGRINLRKSIYTLHGTTDQTYRPVMFSLRTV